MGGKHHENDMVSLGSYFEVFIKAKIAQGRYNNASEVILPDCACWKRMKAGSCI